MLYNPGIIKVQMYWKIKPTFKNIVKGLAKSEEGQVLILRGEGYYEGRHLQLPIINS
jgi:hypothetical protein